MKCEEALTKIEAYINHTLNRRELEEFLEHVTSCQECYDELETYYIISVVCDIWKKIWESYNIQRCCRKICTQRTAGARKIFSGKQQFFLVLTFFHSDTGSGTFLSGTSGTAQTF